MSSKATAIAVQNLAKSYVIAHTAEPTTLAEAMMTRLRHPFKRTPAEIFWALNGVSFEIKKGDVVGIIGRNGAGKSTLLKVLSRITEPTSGEIDLYGRVGSLLEVGTGFHPELTGRENVYLNGAILGMKRADIQRQFDAIVAFAEIERFLDTPVKWYSSGMYVRLAFAVAAHLNPEILIVDEVLAVGDAQFQEKCLGKMQEVSHNQGRTVLFVSHNMPSITQLCDTALWLDKGKAVEMGPAPTVVGDYLRRGSQTRTGEQTWTREEAPGCADLRLYAVRVLDTEGKPTALVDMTKGCSFEFDYEVFRSLRGLRVCYLLYNASGQTVFTSSDARSDADGSAATDGGEISQPGV